MSSGSSESSEPQSPGQPPTTEKAGAGGIVFRPFAALRDSMRGGYTRRDLRADILSGLIVGIVALPLSMALAIATGVPPQNGLYTAIIAGFAVALLGGSRTQVTGPTAAFVVILVPIAQQYGLGGLAVASMIAGMMLMLMGLTGLGKLVQFVPYPVTTGFTAGIAVVIATIQLKDFFGLVVAKMPNDYLERAHALLDAAPSARWQDAAAGAATLALLILWPRISRRVPAPLVALGVVSVAAFILSHSGIGFSVDTIGSRFTYTLADGSIGHGIPAVLPQFAFPWNLPGPGGAPLELNFTIIRSLVVAAFAIAMLGAIESLLSAVVADGMTGTRHDPDAELFAQGCGNVLGPFFGGFAATGAIARTATNVRSGGRSPIASMVHAGVVLLSMVVLAPMLGHVPMAALAGLLLVVAWRMSDARHFVHIARCAPRSDVFVLLTCFTLTIVFDMVVSVTFGVVAASLLFMRRMAEVSGARLVGDQHHGQGAPLPNSVQMYEVAGPLFFGAAQKAMRALDTTQAAAGRVRVVVLDMRGVPSIDATGAVALESALSRLDRIGVMAVLAGVQPHVRPVLLSHGLIDRPGKLAIIDDFHRAVNVARLVVDAEADHTTLPVAVGERTRMLGDEHRVALPPPPPGEERSL